MKKVILIVIPSIILAVVAFLLFQIFLGNKKAKGALQVTASPESKVYIDDKLIGQTPLCKCEDEEMLDEGDYTIRLVPESSSITPYEEKITIEKSVLTVVDRKFSSSGKSEGSIISLTPLPDKDAIEILVVSIPDQSEVYMDSNLVGKTPILLKKDITESDHTLRVAKKGYTDKTVRIRTTKGYKLNATVYLGVGEENLENEPEPTKPQEELDESTPTPAKNQTVTILETPNGFLRVRKDASLNSPEITRVKTGEKLVLLDEKTGWYQIELEDGESGWISQDFAEKSE